MNIKAFIANKSGKIIEHKSKEKEPNLWHGLNDCEEILKIFGTDTTCLVLKDGMHIWKCGCIDYKSKFMFGINLSQNNDDKLVKKHTQKLHYYQVHL
jgi:hypothetical protein